MRIISFSFIDVCVFIVLEKKVSPLKKETHKKVSKYFQGETVSASNIFSAKPIKRDNSRNIVKVKFCIHLI